MIRENFIALAKVIKNTRRFDMGLIVGRWSPEDEETYVEVETPTDREMWDDPTLVGDYCAWANCLSEFAKLDDEDHAAAWLGITIDEFDQLSYVSRSEQYGRPSLWERQRLHYELDWIDSGDYGRVDSSQITPEIAADLLERLARGELEFL